MSVEPQSIDGRFDRASRSIAQRTKSFQRWASRKFRRELNTDELTDESKSTQTVKRTTIFSVGGWRLDAKPAKGIRFILNIPFLMSNSVWSAIGKHFTGMIKPPILTIYIQHSKPLFFHRGVGPDCPTKYDCSRTLIIFCRKTWVNRMQSGAHPQSKQVHAYPVWSLLPKSAQSIINTA